MTSTSTAPSATYVPNDVHPTIRRAYTIFNARDFAAIAECFTNDVTVTVMPTGATLTGIAGVEQFMRGWISAFDDGHVEISTLAQAGDIAVCEFRGIGTHTGPFVTPNGTIEPTGRRVDVPFCDVIAVRDGRIAALRTYFDAATFVRQLTS